MGAETARAEFPADSRAWRPQTAYQGRFRPGIVDPLLEPRWDGTRVLAYFVEAADADEWGTVDVLDARGQDAAHTAPRALDELRRSIAASAAILDGIITDQAIVGGEGVAPIFVAPSPLRRLFNRGREGGRRTPREPAFVALDLLSIDGQVLLDVPLLERKRLLEGALRESELVRLTPWARPPRRSWFATWRAAGFREMVIKGANSHYVPGQRSLEWAIVNRMP